MPRNNRGLFSIASQNSRNGPAVETDSPLPLLVAIAILKHAQKHDDNTRIWQQPGCNKVPVIGLRKCLFCVPHNFILHVTFIVTQLLP